MSSALEPLRQQLEQEQARASFNADHSHSDELALALDVLQGEDLDKLTPKEIRKHFSVLVSSVETLDFSEGHGLPSEGVRHLQTIFSLIKSPNSKVVNLNLSDCGLQWMNLKQLKIIFDCLAESKIKVCVLTSNHFGRWKDPRKWNVLFNFIEKKSAFGSSRLRRYRFR